MNVVVWECSLVGQGSALLHVKDRINAYYCDWEYTCSEAAQRLSPLLLAMPRYSQIKLLFSDLAYDRHLP